MQNTWERKKNTPILNLSYTTDTYYLVQSDILVGLHFWYFLLKDVLKDVEHLSKYLLEENTIFNTRTSFRMTALLLWCAVNHMLESTVNLSLLLLNALPREWVSHSG